MRARRAGGVLIGVLAAGMLAAPAFAQTGLSLHVGGSGSGLQLSVNEPSNPEDLSGLLKIFLLLTVVSLAPAILVLCTSFTRIIIVLSFLRHALGLNGIPPNQVMIALALFLTAFSMQPVWNQIQTQAIQPYQAGRISWQQLGEQGLQPIRAFMLKNARPKDVSLFVRLARQPHPIRPQDIPLLTLIPAFVVSELRIAFQIGFLLFLPFLVVDMVVASILLSMGMMMLPPVMISLPFKILLFVMVDGWNLLVISLLRSFY